MRAKLDALALERATTLMINYGRLDDEYDEWDLENPPRVSKGSKPKFGIDGRSVFDIVRAQIKRGA